MTGSTFGGHIPLRGDGSYPTLQALRVPSKRARPFVGLRIATPTEVEVYACPHARSHYSTNIQTGIRRRNGRFRTAERPARPSADRKTSFPPVDL